MRLRWPWQKPERTTSTVRPSTSDRSAPASPPVQRAPLDEWRDLAPPAGLSGPPDLTADRRFGRATSGGRGLPPVIESVARGGGLAPLMRFSGSPSTPPSDGPAAGYGRSAQMTFRPRRRRDEVAAAEPAGQPEVDGPAAPSSSDLPEPSVPNRALGRAAPSDATATSTTPRQRSAMTVVPVAQRSAITESTASGRIELDRTPTAKASEPTDPEAQPGPASEVPTPVPPASVAGASPAAAAGRSAAQRSPLAGAGRTVRTRPAARTHKLGLGEPIASPSRTVEATPKATTARATEPVPSVSPPMASRASEPAREPATAVTMASEIPATAPSLPPATPFTAASLEPRADPVEVAWAGPAQVNASAEPTQALGQRAPQPTSAPIRQRAPRSRAGVAPSAPLPTPRATGRSAGKVHIDRSSDASSAAADLDANAYTAGDTIVMPQHHGPLDSGRGQALLAHELVHVGQQRRMGASLPPEHTSAGQQLEREAQSAESLVERRRSAPVLDMPVARPQRAAAEAGSSHSSEVQQATRIALSAGSNGSSIDAVDLPANGASASAADGPGPQRAAISSASSRSSSAAAGAEGGETKASKATDDQEFEELARKLYDRLRHRLKRELLLDRERGGFLVDSR